MIFLLVFAILILAAAAFAAWPVLRLKDRPRPARLSMAAALVLLVLGVGCGLYIVLGRPDLALRNTQDAIKGHDVRALVALLAEKVRDTPDDPRGFVFLGRGYLTLNASQVLGNKELSFGLVTDWGYKLLSFEGDNDTTMSIDNVITPTLIGAFGLKLGGAELELGVGVPFVVVSGDRGPDFAGDPGKLGV